ncbi:helix-turn-helix domain-containing protein [Streptomyces sp. RCH5-5]|uniref:helix-turn-helix domain-containing protein n=1 Tax=unclassified Streptomyces TaxID=2593676 RepID=UPI003A4DA512
MYPGFLGLLDGEGVVRRQQGEEQIAAGLARHLSYADIARRLNRPASTLSREVARNGALARYRAELAQLATTHRAQLGSCPRHAAA